MRDISTYECASLLPAQLRHTPSSCWLRRAGRMQAAPGDSARAETGGGRQGVRGPRHAGHWPCWRKAGAKVRNIAKLQT